MRVLVTGGSGFIGTNYIELLRANGCAEFVNLSNAAPRNHAHSQFWQECDLLDASRLQRVVRDFRPTHVVHLAARCGLTETTLTAYAVNMDGTENLLNSLEKCPSVERVIFTSSMLVCRVGYIPRHDTDYQATTLYGQSKVRMEQIIRSRNNLPYCWMIVRPISIWGLWCEEPYKNFFKAIGEGWYFHVGHGHYRKSLGYVENTAYQIHKLLKGPVAKVDRKTFYLADDPPTDLHEFANTVKEALGARAIPCIPIGLIKVAAKVGDLLKVIGWRSVPMNSFRLNNILTEYVFDLAPIMEIVGPLPYELKTGVERTAKWVREVSGIS